MGEVKWNEGKERLRGMKRKMDKRGRFKGERGRVLRGIV